MQTVMGFCFGIKYFHACLYGACSFNLYQLLKELTNQRVVTTTQEHVIGTVAP